MRKKSPDLGTKSYSYQCLMTWLAQSNTYPPFCNVQVPDITPPPAMLGITVAQTSVPNILSMDSGLLSPGATITDLVEIDTAGLSTMSLSWITGTLLFTLTQPDGQVIDPAYTSGHSNTITYDSMKNDWGDPSYATYSFTSTMSGKWQLNIKADNFNAGESLYQVVTTINSTRTLTVESDKSSYNIGDTAYITATLKSNGIGITGTAITVTVQISDEITDVLSLSDKGYGLYEGTYQIPNVPGFANALVEATGDDNGQAFSRQSSLFFAITPNNLAVAAPFVDSVKDFDGNGFFDVLDYSLAVTATQSGDYIVVGDIKVAPDQFVHTMVFTNLVAGTNIITMPFDADTIFRFGKSGGYTLTNISLSDASLGNFTKPVTNITTSSNYDVCQFEHNEFLNIPTLSSPLSTTITSTQRIELSWLQSNCATGYLVDVSGVVTDVGDVTSYMTGILRDGVYTWTVAAYDGLGNRSPYADSWQFEVDTTAPVQPQLITPFDKLITHTDSLTLSWRASSSDDVSGYLVDVSGVVTDVGDVTSYMTGILRDGVYTWTVAAYDGLGNRSLYTDSWQFEVDTTAPVANAGSAQTVIGGESITLDGSLSNDPEGQPLSYGWLQTGGTAVSFTSNFSVTTFTASATTGVMTFTLTVTDSGGLTDSDTVTVRVADGDAAEPVAPDAEATLIVPGQGMTITVPAGSVSQPMTLVFRSISNSHPVPGGRMFAGHAFALEAYLGSVRQTGVTFSPPLTLTLDYTPGDVPGMDEDTLNLRYWSGSAWASDGISIAARDTAHNRLTLTIAHLTEFGLFGQSKGFSVYLPLVLK